jgi:hypothetical protein
MAPPRKKAALSTDNKEGRITAWANISSDESEPSSIVEVAAASKGPDVDEQLVEVIIPLVDIDVDVYREAPGQNSVRKVISKTKVRKTKQLLYKVKFKDGHTEDVSTESKSSQLP